MECIAHLKEIEDPTEFEEERHVVSGEIEINFLGYFDGHVFVRFEVIVITILGHKSLNVTMTVDFNQMNIGEEGAVERHNNPANRNQVRSAVPLGFCEIVIVDKSAREREENTTGKGEDGHGVPTGVGREGLAMAWHSVEHLVELL